MEYYESTSGKYKNEMGTVGGEDIGLFILDDYLVVSVILYKL